MLPISLLGLPAYYLVLLAGLFGVIVGSFLNVVIYRFHTGKSLSGRSHCLSCGKGLCWYHLLPVVSYLFLRGRCAHCRSVFTPRYLLVELLTGFLFVAAALRFTDIIELIFSWVALALLVIVVVYDLRHMIIPDELVIALTVLAGLWLGYGVFVTGASTMLDVALTVAAALSAAAFFFALWYYSAGRWIGFGDVKLVIPLGIMVGGAGVFSMVVLSFWVGAAVSVALLAAQALVRRGKPTLRLRLAPLTMKSAVPFAPFLIAGCILVLLFSVDVLALFYYDPALF